MSFRLSEDEAAYLIEKADASGARSVSEYVRLVALEVANKDFRRRDISSHSGAGQVRGISGDENAPVLLLSVLRALEDALRAARQEIGKD